MEDLLRQVDVSRLEAGAVFDRPLLDHHGRVLLRADTDLTPDMLASLRAAGTSVWTTSAPELPEDQPSAAAEAEQDNAPSPPELGEHSARELARQHREQALAAQRVRAHIRNRAHAIIAARKPRWSRLPLHIEPANTEPSPAAPSIELPVENGIDDHADRVALLAHVFARLAAGESVGTGGITELALALMDDAQRRPSALIRDVLTAPRRLGDVAEHAYATASLCALMASTLGYEPHDCHAATLAGMLADAGMAIIVQPVLTVGRQLTDVEINELYRHPEFGAALLEQFRAAAESETIPEEVQLAVYQHHERENGMGYPERVKGSSIHDLAKLVAIADTFAAAIAPRAHRPPLDPAQAMAEVVRQANSGMLSRAFVRTLVQIFGPYPVGSKVHLSSGRTGIVVDPSHDPARPDRPVIAIISQHAEDSERIDLSRLSSRDIRVIKKAA